MQPETISVYLRGRCYDARSDDGARGRIGRDLAAERSTLMGDLPEDNWLPIINVVLNSNRAWAKAEDTKARS
jgi:hypothetical protein